MKNWLALGAIILLSACVSAPAPKPRIAAPAERTASAFPLQRPTDKRGLEAVIGKDIGTVKRVFGEPRLDVVEVNGRKLQFVGKACVLDIYFYPDGKNGSHIATHVDARRSDGAEVDRSQCIEALQRR
ncbi:MAG: hypothetical protein WBO17_09245 [Sphingorhabdus sp.]